MGNPGDTNSSGSGALPAGLRRAMAWGAGHHRLEKIFGMVVHRTSMGGRLEAAETSKRHRMALIRQRCKKEERKNVVRADIY